jgi:hypothetical protein
MRRILIGLTLLVLVVVSAAIGALVADWPQCCGPSLTRR